MECARIVALNWGEVWPRPEVVQRLASVLARQYVFRTFFECENKKCGAARATLRIARLKAELAAWPANKPRPVRKLWWRCEHAWPSIRIDDVKCPVGWPTAAWLQLPLAKRQLWEGAPEVRRAKRPEYLGVWEATRPNLQKYDDQLQKHRKRK